MEFGGQCSHPLKGKHLTVAYYVLPPDVYPIDDKGNVDGVMVEYLKAISERFDFDVSYINGPFLQLVRHI